MKLAHTVLEYCQQYAVNTCWVAYSGGVDSRVLLDVCHQIKDQLPVTFKAIHVHHGLSAYADDWSRHCAEVCNDYQIQYHEERVVIADGAGSPEELARNARYAVFADLVKPGDVLLTAHHQDDQAETLLVQLLRGAGPKGLAAMPQVKVFSQGKHLRPFLYVGRQELLDYAHARHLKWVEDESNSNRAFTRNYIRHEIMPLLKKRWPNVEATMMRSAVHCAESQMLLEDVATDRLAQLAGARYGSLSVAALKELSPAWQRLLLRVWIEKQGFSLPETSKIFTIQTNVLYAARDKSPCVAWNGAEVRRYKDDICIMLPVAQVEVDEEWQWDLTDHLTLEPIGTLNAESVAGDGLRADIGPVTVRFRKQGETVDLGARGRLSLKNLFQEWQVPVWERSRVPLIFREGKLVQAVGYFLDPAYTARNDQPGLSLRLMQSRG